MRWGQRRLAARMAQAHYDLCRRCTRPVPPRCDLCETCGHAVLVDVAAWTAPVMMVRRVALEDSVRKRRTLRYWTYIPLSILALGMLLTVIRFLSFQTAQAGEAVPSPQLGVPTQLELSGAVEKSAALSLARRAIPEEQFVNAYVTANYHDTDLDGYTAGEIAELADVEFRMRYRTCGPPIVCSSDTISVDSRGMRAIRWIEATTGNAQANQPSPQNSR